LSTKIFEAEVWTIDGSNKVLKYTYQPILNIKHVRQGCKIRNPSDLLIEKKDEENTFEKLRNLISSEDVCLQNSKECLDKFKLGLNHEKKISNHKKSININTEESFEINSTKRTKVVFEFMFNPVYLTIGSQIIISDQHLKAYGIVTKIFK
jgi:hypothetical protein